MSFPDASGNNWSALFETVEVMLNMLKVIVATVAHMATVTDSGPASGVIVAALPPLSGPAGNAS
jgi:hypothetical protein